MKLAPSAATLIAESPPNSRCADDNSRPPRNSSAPKRLRAGSRASKFSISFDLISMRAGGCGAACGNADAGNSKMQAAASPLVWWFRSPLERCGEFHQGTSEPNHTRIITFQCPLESEVRCRRRCGTGRTQIPDTGQRVNAVSAAGRGAVPAPAHSRRTIRRACRSSRRQAPRHQRW